MKKLILTDDEYDALGDILQAFPSYSNCGVRLRTYAYVISHHMREGEKKNENNEKGKKES